MDYSTLSECGIPERMHGGLIRYIEHHVPPGDFLIAVLSNDLKETLGRADYENQYLLKNYVVWLYNYAPMNCWGSPEFVDNWLQRRQSER